MSHKLVSLYIGNGEYYTRIDADNVIAELKKLVHDCTQGRASAEKELRHQKYKRCLAMALLCFTKGKEKQSVYKLRTFFWSRWGNRWSKLAEKFKEAK